MLVGREAELTTVSTLMSDVGAAGGRVVLIRGEAGVGKSALVRELAARHRHDADVLTGWCDDLTTPQPLGPLWDVARDRPALLARLAAGDRPGVWHETLQLLTDPTRPTLLVIEDTHWADEATLDTITYLGRRIARANGLLVLTYRDGEVDVDHPLRGVIGALPPELLVRIHLECLPVEAVQAMVGETGLDVAEVVALTGGNPLFVSEVIVGGTGGVPASIQDAVLARAAKLSAGARALVDLASVVPGTASRNLLDAVLAPTPEQLAECARQGLLRVDDESVMFHHELTRRAVESSLSDVERRRLNRVVLAAIDDDRHLAQRVHHAVEAGDVEAVVRLAPAAARAALAISSHREAAAHFRALEPHLDRLPLRERAGIVEDWARTEVMLASVDAVEILDRAIALRRADGDGRALARALTFAVRQYQVAGRAQDADECATEAVSLLASGPPSAELAAALLARAWLTYIRGDHHTTSVGIADEALAIARAAGDDVTVTKALIIKGIGDDAQGHTLTPLVEEALGRAQEAGLADDETYALIVLAAAAADARDIERAADLVQRARDTAARHELRHWELLAHAMHAEILLWQGRWAAAEDAAVTALGSTADAEHIAWRVLATIQMRRGRPEAAALLEKMWSSVATSDALQYIDPAAAVTAEHLWLTGRQDPTETARLRAIFERGERSTSPWPSSALAFWLWKLGLVGDAQCSGDDLYGAIVDGDWPRAAAFWEARGAPYDRALALAHGDTTARLAALDLFETLGARATAERLRRQLRDEGVRAPRGRARATRDHDAGLTARQAEVLALLAEGLSNAQIADRLFISPRTAENHVSAVLMKLGAPTRAAAVAAARARPVRHSG